MSEPGGFSAFFEIFTNFGKTVSDGLDRIHSKMDITPLFKDWGQSGNSGGLTTVTLIIPDSPSPGRMWFVHRVTVLGADGHTSVAGALADVYTGPGQEANAPNEIYSALPLPTIIVEGMHHNPVRPNEQVYAIFYNLPANQVIQFAIGIQDYPYDARAARTIQGTY